MLTQDDIDQMSDAEIERMSATLPFDVLAAQSRQLMVESMALSLAQLAQGDTKAAAESIRSASCHGVALALAKSGQAVEAAMDGAEGLRNRVFN